MSYNSYVPKWQVRLGQVRIDEIIRKQSARIPIRP